MLTPERLACAMYQALRRASDSRNFNALSHGAMVSGHALSRSTLIDGTFDLVKIAEKVIAKLEKQTPGG